jgi:hypothetical protein
MARTVSQADPVDPRAWVPKGLHPDEWERQMVESGDDGVPVSLSPDYHSHPVLDLEHLHDAGRHPHTHRPQIGWDPAPIPLKETP